MSYLTTDAALLQRMLVWLSHRC